MHRDESLVRADQTVMCRGVMQSNLDYTVEVRAVADLCKQKKKEPATMSEKSHM